MASQIARNRRLTSCTHILGAIVLLMLASMCQSAGLDAYVAGRSIHHGRIIEKIVVPGSPPPPIRMMAVMAPVPNTQMGTNSLSGFPALDWCYGCSATSAAMLFGYYDTHGYPNMYTGAANGGDFPSTNAVWGYGECPLSASHLGIDGRVTRGHVDDYWIDYGAPGPDPYSGHWAQHTPLDCTADFMGTSQWAYSNTDGETCFYGYPDGAPLYDYTACEPAGRDGCHGMRLFAESRGYAVLENFTQYVYDGGTDGFTFSEYKAEIDAGRPVLIHVVGHSMIGFGYKDTGSKVSICDTWDHSYHEMTWGGSYDGMAHWGVTVLRLAGTGDFVTIDLGPTSTPNPVSSGGDVSLYVSASSSEGRALSYEWTAVDEALMPAGSFDNPSLAAPTWTAPENTSGETHNCVISVTVTSTSGASASGSVIEQVGSPERAVTITTGPTSATNPCASEGTTQLSVTAEENLGGELEYTWWAIDEYGYPAGSFSQPHAAETTWTAPENPGGADAQYQISVSAVALADPTVYDSATITQYVNHGNHEVTIAAGPSATPNPTPAESQVQLDVTAACNIEGHAVDYLWSVGADSQGNSGSLDDATARNPIWTPPTHTADCAYTYEVSVTVTCAEDPSVSATGTISVQVEPVAHTVEITSGPSGTPNPVDSGGQVQCSVTAEDTREEHALAYEWTATGGSFSNANAAAPIWTAPENLTDGPVEYEISVVVSCATTPTVGDTASFMQQVNPVDHAIQITAGATGIPNPVAAEGAVQCSVTAVDSRGHEVDYLWSVTGPQGAPTGSFDSNTSANPVWTAPANETGQTLEYVVWVTCTCIEDPNVVTTVSFIARVNPSGHAVIVESAPAGAPNPAASGQQVQCSVTASDTEGHVLAYQWTALDGQANPAGTFENPTDATSVWTAPENYTDATIDYEISVTAACASDPDVLVTVGYTQQVLPVAHTVSIVDGPCGDAELIGSLESLECTVTATDSRDGHTLSYLWSATDADGKSAGSFDDPTLPTATWTAPFNGSGIPETCAITLVVRCASDPSVNATGIFTVAVLPGCQHTFSPGTRMIGIPVDLPAGLDVSTALARIIHGWSGRPRKAGLVRPRICYWAPRSGSSD